MSTIGLYDIVDLAEDVPGTRFKAGMSGTVIDALPGGAWEVEFEELEEETGEIVTAGFRPDQLRLGASYEEIQRAVIEAKTVTPSYGQPKAVPAPTVRFTIDKVKAVSLRKFSAHQDKSSVIAFPDRPVSYRDRRIMQVRKGGKTAKTAAFTKYTLT